MQIADELWPFTVMCWTSWQCAECEVDSELVCSFIDALKQRLLKRNKKQEWYHIIYHILMILDFFFFFTFSQVKGRISSFSFYTSTSVHNVRPFAISGCASFVITKEVFFLFCFFGFTGKKVNIFSQTWMQVKNSDFKC